MAKKKVVARKKRKEYTIEDGVTQSMLSTHGDCQQQSVYELDGWEADKGKDALVFGHMLHDALEHWYGGKYKTILGVIDNRTAAWQKEQKLQMIDAQAAELMIAWMHILLPEYVEYYKKEDAKLRWVELEGVFDIMWRGFRLRGRCDGIPMIRKKHWLFETKSTSRVEGSLTEKLAFDFQNLFYVTAKREQLKKELAGVLYNMVRKPQLKQRKTESIAEYIERVRADVAERPEFYFLRFEITYPAQVQERFRDDLEIKLSIFKQWWEDGHVALRNECACVRGWVCDFLSACASCSMAGYKQTRKQFRELED